MLQFFIERFHFISRRSKMASLVLQPAHPALRWTIGVLGTILVLMCLSGLSELFYQSTIWRPTPSGWPFEAGNARSMSYDQPRWEIYTLFLLWVHSPVGLAVDLYVIALLVSSLIVDVVKLFWNPSRFCRLNLTNLFAWVFAVGVMLSFCRYEAAANFRKNLESATAIQAFLEPYNLDPGVDFASDLADGAPVRRLVVLLAIVSASHKIAGLAWKSALWTTVVVGCLLRRGSEIRSRLAVQGRPSGFAAQLLGMVILPLGIIGLVHHRWYRSLHWPPMIERVEYPKACEYRIRDFEFREFYVSNRKTSSLEGIRIEFRQVPTNTEAGVTFHFEPGPGSDYQIVVPGRVLSSTPRMAAAFRRLEQLFSPESLEKMPWRHEATIEWGDPVIRVYFDDYEQMEPFHAMDESFYRKHR